MKLVPYDSFKHREHAKRFLSNREMSKDLVDQLPKSGLVAFENDIPIAMGFLREVEGNYAMLDSYLTDPTISGELRDIALDRITDKLITIATHYNQTLLLAISEDVNTIARSIRHGFKFTDYKVTRLKLNN